MKSRIVKIGEVGVDSGQLVICDPCYIESEFKTSDVIKMESRSPVQYSDHAHEIFKHKDGSYWQFTYDKQPMEGVNKFPGSYADVIAKYGKSPNDLIKAGDFVKQDKMDPTPHIPEGEFSYRGICKATVRSENQSGQLNYTLGHAGVAVAFCTGYGDGTYEVFAELIDTGEFGERVRKVWVQFL